MMLLALLSCSEPPEPPWQPTGSDVTVNIQEAPRRSAEELRPHIAWLTRWAVVGTPHHMPSGTPRSLEPGGATGDRPQPNMVAWDATNALLVLAAEGELPYEVLVELNDYGRISAFQLAELDARGCERAAREWLAGPALHPDEERRRWWTMKNRCESALEPWSAEGAPRADLERVAVEAEENGWWSR